MYFSAGACAAFASATAASAGFLSAAQGVHLGLHDLLHQRLGRGDLLRRGHGGGEEREEGEEEEEHGFHWGLLFLAV